MMNLVRQSGPAGTLIVILALVIAALVVRRAIQLFRRSFTPGPAWDAALNSILFWGAFTAVLGFLGQCLGIYHALTEISRASEISPTVTAMGFYISFTPTLLGLAVLLIAGLCWYALRFWSHRAQRSLAV
jgi:flagellar biogenesis protein FliO